MINESKWKGSKMYSVKQEYGRNTKALKCDFAIKQVFHHYVISIIGKQSVYQEDISFKINVLVIEK